MSTIDTSATKSFFGPFVQPPLMAGQHPQLPDSQQIKLVQNFENNQPYPVEREPYVPPVYMPPNQQKPVASKNVVELLEGSYDTKSTIFIFAIVVILGSLWFKQPIITWFFIGMLFLYLISNYIHENQQGRVRAPQKELASSSESQYVDMRKYQPMHQPNGPQRIPTALHTLPQEHVARKMLPPNNYDEYIDRLNGVAVDQTVQSHPYMPFASNWDGLGNARDPETVFAIGDAPGRVMRGMQREPKSTFGGYATGPSQPPPPSFNQPLDRVHPMLLQNIESRGALSERMLASETDPEEELKQKMAERKRLDEQLSTQGEKPIPEFLKPVETNTKRKKAMEMAKASNTLPSESDAEDMFAKGFSSGKFED